MKIFVINLKRGYERRKRIKKQLDRIGVDFEFVEAVDGRSLSRFEKEAAINRFLFWCHVGRNAFDGEIGCALSHAKIYKWFVERQNEVGVTTLPCICVLEDDAVLSSNFCEILNNVEEGIDPEKAQVVLLSNHGDRKLFTDGYVITQKAAKVVLDANMPMKCPCDYWWLWEKKNLLEVSHSVPPVVTQDIHQTMIGRSKAFFQMSLMEKVAWKIKRAIGLGFLKIAHQ